MVLPNPDSLFNAWLLGLLLFELNLRTVYLVLNGEASLSLEFAVKKEVFFLIKVSW